VAWGRDSGISAPLLMALLAAPAILTFGQKRHPLRFGLSIAAMLCAGAMARGEAAVLHAERTFFGVYRVTIDDAHRYRTLVHGTTLHGIESAAPGPHEPLSYYHRTGPIGQALTTVPAAVHARNVAVIGLGVGSLAAYARADQHWDFYEIDPAVERIARTSSYFTHLSACGRVCTVVLGDARLSLAKAAPHAYDVMVVDAFSSDAIPVHLLTREAVGVYLAHLAPGGLLAFHISNNHLSLAPVVAALAASHGLAAVERYDTDVEGIERKNASRWVVLSRTADNLGSLAHDPGWSRLSQDARVPVWTDDFSNILSVLRTR
jgi:spermidine synthase